MTRHDDTQGKFCGLPYDFRRPTLPRVAKRLYQPGGPMLVPKIWGIGWTLNLAHPMAQLILLATLVACTVAIAFS